MQPEDLDEVQTPAPVLELPGLSPLPLEPEREPFWDYVDLLLMIGLVFAGTLLVGLALSGWLHYHPELKGDLTQLELPSQYLIYGLVYLSFYLVFKFRHERPVLHSLGWIPSNYNLLLCGIGGVVLAFVIGFIANLIHTPKVDTPFEQLAKTPLSMALLALTAVVAAPLFEEMVFRGFLQPLLSRTFGVVAGVLSTALLFGGLHGKEYDWAWQYIVAISLVGLALGTLRAKSNSIIPGVIMHGCFNSISVVGLFFAKYITHK